ncbi:alpha/beta hydrolase [Aspergillus ibericus CBS 121593]|uniref:Toxin biosynthesis protein-like protein n=1 Tax=Aspergillus ibericus CBS 121593 TaxID=1448316 RepID=A0A395GVF0_9EURO|nr:toxin biosynthesis protein-like protein [Aspergillus ibericus CBS 121593]RAK98073.1 toxin biosynthesis protein-like protein [Aspergillus ibericus CBS 121593]
MSSDKFTITEHVVPCCHIREYPGSTVQQEDLLKLHVKQYTPKHQPQPVPPDAITFIAAHGAALPKELYEPLWDELLAQATGFHIRSIWVADCASMSASGILNEDKLSIDFSWMDHPRDLLLMINHFREQMPRPLVGIGHSFGGNIITNLAYLHPRLFTTLLLIDPAIQLNPPPMGFGTDAPGAINYTLRRKDVWPSREAAVRANRSLFHGWDPRCVDLMARYGFRDLPTRLYPDVAAIQARFDSSDTPVTLTTTKYQDLVAQIRENFSARNPTTGRIEIPQATHADMDPPAAFIPLYRPEPRSTFFRLPSLRPSCLWVLGGATYLNLDEMRLAIQTCGTGVGGSGGVPEGRVKEVTLPGLGHLMPFQNVGTVAEPCVAWLQDEMDRFRRMEREWEEARKGKSHLVVEENWYKVLRPLDVKPSKSGGKAKL